MGRLGAEDNGIEAWFASCPRLRSFVPALLAGAVEVEGAPVALAPTALIFLGGHAGRAMEPAREAGLRGEMRIERNLG